MTEQTNTPPAAAPQPSPADQRAALMSDRTFTAAAAAGKGPQWEQLQGLDRQIAELNSITDDEPAAPGSQAHAKAIVDAHESGEDQDEAADQALAFINKVPARPGEYDLPTESARQLGLKVDGEREGVLRQAFHAAEVPQSLAALMYTAAITAARVPEQDRGVHQGAEKIKSTAALQTSWGKDFDLNLAMAEAEAQRIFAALPRTVTNGADFDSYVRASGLQHNRVVIEALYNRARARRA
jgi:hypothetical protein